MRGSQCQFDNRAGVRCCEECGVVLHLGEPHLFGFEAGLDPRGALLAGLIEDVRHVLGLLA